MRSQELLLSLMEKSIEDPLDSDLFFRTTSQWLSFVHDASIDPASFFSMERELAESVDMSSLAYRILSGHIGNVSSKKELDRAQCFGFVFQIQSTRRYSPVIELSSITREKLSLLLKKHTKFPGEIAFSSTAAAIPAGTQDFLPYDFLIAMEKSMSQSVVTPNFSIATLPSAAAINVFVIAKLSLSNDFNSPFNIWEDACERLALREEKHSIEMVFSPLSRRKARLMQFGYDIFPLCESVWGASFQKVAHELRILQSVDDTSPRIEFSLSMRSDAIYQSLPSTNVFAHIMNGEENITSIHVAQTSCPAMAMGWMVHAIHTYVSPFCEIGSRKI